jgi:glutamyl-Q tRNA(Asp) synthetase
VPHSLRLNMQKALAAAPGPHRYRRFNLPDLTEEEVAAQPQRWGDVILARKETPASYHLSVVVDDALQGVTHVVRGQDLEAATDLHVLLQSLLGLTTPLYHHHALLTEPEGEKLAKSKGSESLADLRARGVTPEEIRASFRL